MIREILIGSGFIRLVVAWLVRGADPVFAANLGRLIAPGAWVRDTSFRHGIRTNSVLNVPLQAADLGTSAMDDAAGRPIATAWRLTIRNSLRPNRPVPLQRASRRLS